MDLNGDFAFVPQPPLEPFSKVPAGAPLPSAGVWSPQPHPAPVEQVDPASPPAPAAPAAGGQAPATPAPTGGDEAAAADTVVPVTSDPVNASVPDGGTSATTTVPVPVPVPVPVTEGTAGPGPTAAAPAPVQVRVADEVKSATSLGPLSSLPGRWTGTGFNVIWRPSNRTGQDHFLEINLTQEDFEFVEIPGDIPNRGLLQGDISMRGLRYLQQTRDANTSSGLHVEPGIWAFVPATVDPSEPETVVRMASIPHGTTVLAQGIAQTSPGVPTIDPVSIAPFFIAVPNQPIAFAESRLDATSDFRSSPEQIAGVTQAMLDDPNSVLREANSGLEIRSSTRLSVSSAPVPVLGGGIANTAFLIGSSGPNAQAALVTSSFWIEEVAGQAGGPDFLQLQYSQTVMLNFAGLSWPHVSVATLRRQP